MYGAVRVSDTHIHNRHQVASTIDPVRKPARANQTHIHRARKPPEILEKNQKHLLFLETSSSTGPFGQDFTHPSADAHRFPHDNAL